MTVFDTQPLRSHSPCNKICTDHILVVHSYTHEQGPLCFQNSLSTVCDSQTQASCGPVLCRVLETPGLGALADSLLG